MIEARHLTKWYPGTLVVSDISFTLRAGEVLGYLGPNGAGKSTTVALLMGLIEPTSGAVLFRDVPITEDPIGFRRHVGYVPEEPRLYSYLSGREYLELVSDLRDLNDRTAARRISALLDVFGLEPHAHTPLSSYSRGMRQKVLIASALLHDPDLLVFDEPTSGLDAMTALVFNHLLNELGARGKAVLYCSHELLAVERTCSRVLVLDGGRLLADDTVSGLRGALAQASLEEVFRRLVSDTDPQQTAKNLAGAMCL